MKRRLKLSIKIILSVLILILVLFLIYGYNLSSVSNTKDNEIIEFKISSGDTVENILNNLKEDNLIRNVFFSKIYVKFNNINNLQAGTYSIDNSKDTANILKILNSGKVTNVGEIKITFPEGKNIRGIAKIIASKTYNKEDDVYILLKDEEYIDSLIKEYWFITEDVKNDELYYPLEGYLFPDTYKLKDKSVSVNDIFKKMLDQMGIILNRYKSDIKTKEFTVHEFLTLASIVESEGVNDEDRATIASVFYNRLDERMSFGSCPTACYATKFDGPCKPSEVNTSFVSPYNTYLSSMIGLPIGPISNPGEESIKAALNPDDTNYLYFLSDKKKVTYFFETLKEHSNKKQELINAKNWPE